VLLFKKLHKVMKRKLRWRSRIRVMLRGYSRFRLFNQADRLCKVDCIRKVSKAAVQAVDLELKRMIGSAQFRRFRAVGWNSVQHSRNFKEPDRKSVRIYVLFVPS
jgi:hypothetical protein